jgi:2-polyprenyl-3-methyl-5-hydroxy-6-metoxy-1,4-benzoquinol methylase
MWEHAVSAVACPRCSGPLKCKVIHDERQSKSEQLSHQTDLASASEHRWIETGVLCCDTCKCVYPVHRGVPILLRYRTRLAEIAYGLWPALLRRELLDSGFHFSTDNASTGEERVGATFSTEWKTYEYGPTLWTAPTVDRSETFRGECGVTNGGLEGKRFCEIGCGLGILTNEAATGLGADAWGIDLSTSVFRAAAQFRANPCVHFVQASIFSAPFKPQQFDFVYSHGVLHHTWSTKEALRCAAELVRPDGTLYVWLYGYDDVRISLLRKLAFALETVTRPLVARLPPPIATVALLPLVPMYQVASLVGKLSGTHGSTYSTKQAMHAARDRFTPLFAHRHEFDEVANWFEEIGLKAIHRVAGAEVHSSWALAIARNVAIRGRR